MVWSLGATRCITNGTFFNLNKHPQALATTSELLPQNRGEGQEVTPVTLQILLRRVGCRPGPQTVPCVAVGLVLWVVCPCGLCVPVDCVSLWVVCPCESVLSSHLVLLFLNYLMCTCVFHVCVLCMDVHNMNVWC